MEIPTAITIAGSDSSGGAGIQADLKTFSALGVHGMSAITSVTAQNSQGVTKIQNIDPGVIRAQIRSVSNDIGISAAKTGMLHTRNIVEVVVNELKRLDRPIVVDPVMVTKSGARLIDEIAINVLKNKLLPLATVATPNAEEAATLVGFPITSIEQSKKAAVAIARMGPEAVVVKGGHLRSGRKVVDVLFYRGKHHLFTSPKVDTKNTHGTGCTFASAIAAELAKGVSLIDSVSYAKEFITEAIQNSLSLGKGHGPVNPMARLFREAERYGIIKELEEAVRILELSPNLPSIIPESQTNLAMAISNAKDRSDVAAIRGRIVNMGYAVKASGYPEFGVSGHVANTIITVMKSYPEVRAAMNVRFDDKILSIARRMKLRISFYDRNKEPPEIRKIEGRTTVWGSEQAVRRLHMSPEVIYHRGAVGKEPMMILLGESAGNVAIRAQEMAEIYTRKT